MKWLRLSLVTFTHQDWFLFCSVLGISGGMATALVFDGSVVQGSILGMAGAAGIGGEHGLKEFLGVWKQRVFETGTGWLTGLTVYSQMLFGFPTLYAGMFLAAVVSALIVQKGILGIVVFFLTMLPHGLVYPMTWYVLFGWSGQFQKKLYILPGILLAAMAGVGASLEAYISPLLTGLL